MSNADMANLFRPWCLLNVTNGYHFASSCYLFYELIDRHDFQRYREQNWKRNYSLLQNKKQLKQCEKSNFSIVHKYFVEYFQTLIIFNIFQLQHRAGHSLLGLHQLKWKIYSGSYMQVNNIKRMQK